MLSRFLFPYYFLFPFCFINANITLTGVTEYSVEEKKFDFIVGLINQHFNVNSWDIIFTVGHFPDELYAKLSHVNYFVNVDIDGEDHYIPDVVPYSSNTIIIKVCNFEDFQKALTKARRYPFWHPPSNIIVYYLTKIDGHKIALTFFTLWYFKSSNVLVLRYDEDNDTFMVSDFTPYTYENYKLESVYGCWTVRKVDIPITNLTNRFACEEECHNVTVHSRRRFVNMGTCLSFDTREIHVNDVEKLKEINFFNDKGRNLHGYPMRGYLTEVQPFTAVSENSDGTYTLERRDGNLWNLIAKLINFTIDLSPNNGHMKDRFHYENIIQQLIYVSDGKVDLFLMPVFVMDMIVVNLDMTFPLKSSGICFVSHRTDFETVLFDINLLIENYTAFIGFFFCFLCLWLGFFLFSAVEKDRFTFDQAGKDFMNTVRNVLSISLFRPPKNGAIRILLFVSIWGYFIINFATQAAITSFFTAFKRGREVDTFEDVIEKGYRIFGMATPDVILPDTEERFRIINSRLIPSHDMQECVRLLATDSHRICLVECSVARYLERNTLDHKGSQYLHVAEEKLHSRYLNMVIRRHSPMRHHFNKYVRTLVEAGIIKKWEEYRYNDIKEDIPFRALRIQDIIGIFEFYGLMVGLSCYVFFVEIGCRFYYWLKNKLSGCLQLKMSGYIKRINRIRKIKKTLKSERKLGKIKLANVATQTQILP